MNAPIPLIPAPEYVNGIPLSLDELALAFAEEHEGDLRYVAFWGRWLEWDGICWTDDRSKNAFDLVRRFCRKVVATRCATVVINGKVVGTIHTFAQADRKIAAEPSVWDLDPDVFNPGDDE